MPGELGLQLAVGQGDDPEALPGVGLQSLPEALRNCTPRGTQEINNQTTTTPNNVLILEAFDPDICFKGRETEGGLIWILSDR